MFYIFIPFNTKVPHLCFLFGRCVFVGRHSLRMLYHLHDLLFTLYHSIFLDVIINFNNTFDVSNFLLIPADKAFNNVSVMCLF